MEFTNAIAKQSDDATAARECDVESKLGLLSLTAAPSEIHSQNIIMLLVVEGVRSDVPFVAVVAVAVSRSRGWVTERVYRALVSSLLHSIDYSLARSLHPTLTPLAAATSHNVDRHQVMSPCATRL
jgi:hypothetical protein